MEERLYDSERKNRDYEMKIYNLEMRIKELQRSNFKKLSAIEGQVSEATKELEETIDLIPGKFSDAAVEKIMSVFTRLYQALDMINNSE
jgi:hypothetical protein